MTTEYMNKDGKYHRVNEPAIEWENGDGCFWWYNGQRHRYYGPAWYYDGYKAYWIFDEEVI